LDRKEFENRWKRAQGRSKTQHVNILDKSRSIMFIANDYSIYSDPRFQLVILYKDGEFIGYIDLDWIYIVA
jgi:hypothetical protein